MSIKITEFRRAGCTKEQLPLMGLKAEAVVADFPNTHYWDGAFACAKAITKVTPCVVMVYEDGNPRSSVFFFVGGKMVTV